MARFLITCEGFRSGDGATLRAALKAKKPKKPVRITGIRSDKVFTNTGLITVSCENMRGANLVRNILWDDMYKGCVEIEKLPEKGYGGRRMGAELPVNSYYD
jgi:hypothetical protein